MLESTLSLSLLSAIFVKESYSVVLPTAAVIPTTSPIYRRHLLHCRSFASSSREPIAFTFKLCPEHLLSLYLRSLNLIYPCYELFSSFCQSHYLIIDLLFRSKRISYFMIIDCTNKTLLTSNLFKLTGLHKLDKRITQIYICS